MGKRCRACRQRPPAAAPFARRACLCGRPGVGGADRRRALGSAEALSVRAPDRLCRLRCRGCSRWCAALSAARFRCRSSVRSLERARTARACAGSCAAAEEAGLDGTALKASKDRLDELQLPAIIHWEGNHWIVLYAVEGDHVRVADPGRGLRRLSRAARSTRSGVGLVRHRSARRRELDDAPDDHLDLRWVRPFVRPLARPARVCDCAGDRRDGAVSWSRRS